MSNAEPSKHRNHARVPVAIPVTFSVLIPEETFQPYAYSAVIVDLSESGAMVRVSLQETVLHELLRKTRYCRLQIENQPGLPDKLVGTAVWIEPETSQGLRTCRIGLFFEHCPRPAAEKLRAYVISTAEDKGVLPETP